MSADDHAEPVPAGCFATGLKAVVTKPGTGLNTREYYWPFSLPLEPLTGVDRREILCAIVTKLDVCRSPRYRPEGA